ncbi:hypothetical protein B9479_004260 [Cryptococcus floricola]|uniref:Knr4/Smi1-like domain-containing protein n=1 Tax=Cryptococcus floricola TaxID=2591691 RepID=A0A5D3AU90_9TREE|nr:hypothetical protein B9479_004260 [Cryptococcus floricola]
MPFLQSLTSFFSQAPQPSSTNNSRRSVIDSTLDAFSLPTHLGTGGPVGGFANGYGEGPHLDSASSSPGPSRRGSNAYGAYGANDTLNSASPNYYPPLSHTLHRLRKTLALSFPELLETFNGPVEPMLLSTFESELGCPLPRAVRDSLTIIDGQDFSATSNVSGNGGLFYGLHWLPLEEVMREWAFWRAAEHDPNVSENKAVLATMASVPPLWIKTRYACKGWIPLLSDRAGNYVGVDLDPGTNGSWGQVILFGRDFDRKCVLWGGDGEGGWGKWLSIFVKEIETGEGWEAEQVSSSDEEEEAGYTSYNGGGSYGDVGSGLKLAGEYRGWNVLEAWWDKSVRKWEALGMGLDIEAVERGLAEARRLTGYVEKGKGKERADGLNVSTSAANSPVDATSPRLAAQPTTPVPRDSDVLLPPSSPEQQIPKIRHPAPSPVRVITPLTSTTEHPLKAGGSGSGYLSPPTNSPPRSRRRNQPPPAPAPAALDLPTRADIQAMSAIAQAETAGLRGGWVMNLDTSAGNAQRRSTLNNLPLPYPIRSSHSSHSSSGRPSLDTSEMVDIDLEGGKAERFGSPKMTPEEAEKQAEEERLAHAGLEHRRMSPVGLPGAVSMSRATSPLANEIGGPQLGERTPKASPRAPLSPSYPPTQIPYTQSLSPQPGSGSIPNSPLSPLVPLSPSFEGQTPTSAMGSSLIRPPPLAANPSLSPRSFSGTSFGTEEEKDRPVIRAAESYSRGRATGSGSGSGSGSLASPNKSMNGTSFAPAGRVRMERENSVISTNSNDELLDGGGRERSVSPSPYTGGGGKAVLGMGVVESPTTATTKGLEEEFQDVKL